MDVYSELWHVWAEDVSRAEALEKVIRELLDA